MVSGSVGGTGGTPEGGEERPNSMCIEGTRSPASFAAGWGAGCGGGRTRGPGWRGQVASVPRVNGEFQAAVTEQICLSQKSVPQVWRVDWVGIRLEVEEIVGVLSPGKKDQWQQTRGTGIKR